MLNAKEVIVPGAVALVISVMGYKKAEEGSPQLKMPEVTFATTEVNGRITELLHDVMNECLTTRTVRTGPYLQSKREILGAQANKVAVMCAQQRDARDTVFKLRIEDRAYKTKDGRRFDPISLEAFGK